MSDIWYEFISPNNIPMVCLGEYNFEMVDSYGWNSKSEYFDGTVAKLRMSIGSPMSTESYDIWYDLPTKDLKIDQVKMRCEVNEIIGLVKRVVESTGYEVLTLFSERPDGFEKYMRLVKINKLRGNE